MGIWMPAMFGGIALIPLIWSLTDIGGDEPLSKGEKRFVIGDSVFVVTMVVILLLHVL